MKDNNINSKILITGSCGFLMSNFVRRVAQAKNQISSIDKGHKEDLGSIYINKSHDFYLANLNDTDILDKIFCIESPDIVIHGAQDKNQDTKILQNVLDVSKRHNVKKLIYISDAQVYGDPGKSCASKAHEASSRNAANNYAKYKFQSEDMVFHSNLNYNIVRLSNIYGPREQSHQLIPGIIRAAIEGSSIKIQGNGSSTREWTHVFDASEGLMIIAKNGLNNEIYNLSSGQEFSTMEAVHAVCSSIEKYHGIKCQHLVKYNGDMTDDFEYPLNVEKLKSIDWLPIYKFKAGVDETVNWYMNNQWKLKI